MTTALEIPLKTTIRDLAHSARVQGPPLLSLPLKQSWLAAEEPDLQPGLAQLYATATGFTVLAVLQDDYIHNSAADLNQKTWTTGDVFEFFIQIAPDRYYEIHVTPENQKLFLQWSPEQFKAVLRKEASFDEALINDPAFSQSMTTVDRDYGYWTVILKVPYASLGLNEQSAKATPLSVAFARYDATPGKEPILSASPDFPRCRFHITEPWHRVQVGEDFK